MRRTPSSARPCDGSPRTSGSTGSGPVTTLDQSNRPVLRECVGRGREGRSATPSDGLLLALGSAFAPAPAPGLATRGNGRLLNEAVEVGGEQVHRPSRARRLDA